MLCYQLSSCYDMRTGLEVVDSCDKQVRILDMKERAQSPRFAVGSEGHRDVEVNSRTHHKSSQTPQTRQPWSDTLCSPPQSTLRLQGCRDELRGEKTRERSTDACCKERYERLSVEKLARGQRLSVELVFQCCIDGAHLLNPVDRCRFLQLKETQEVPRSER